jgi:hypothetical protein
MSAKHRPLINTLVKRLFDARAKQKLEELLKTAKKRGGAKRGAYKTTVITSPRSPRERSSGSTST